MDSLALIEFGCFQNPHVVTSEMTKWQRLTEEVFLQYFASLGLSLALIRMFLALISWIGNALVCLIETWDSSLVSIHVSFFFFPFLLLMLLDQTNFVLIKVPKYIIIIQKVLVAFVKVLDLLISSFVYVTISFIVELLGSLLDIIKSIECIHELNHTFRILFLFLHVTLYKVGQWKEIESVLVKFFRAIEAHILE
jgi:hypothetical protein